MKKIFLSVIAIITLSSCIISQKTDTKKVRLQFIRNATLKLDYNGTTFLVDPSLSPKNSFMSFVVPNKNLNPTIDLPLPIDVITKGVDALLVTHTHLDHFDEGAKTQLNPELPLFGQAFDKKTFEESPFKNISLIDHKQTYKGTTIIRTKGKHGPDQLTEALGEVSGFVLQAANHPTVYIVGDCLFDDEIKNTIKTYNPDIIVMNTGGAQWGGAKILMDEMDAIALAKFAPEAQIIAVHMEALDHCKTTREVLKQKAKEAHVAISIPTDGETLSL